MAFVPVVSSIEVVWKYPNIGNGRALSRIFVRYTGGPPAAADCVAIAGSIRSHFSTRFAALFLSGYQVTPFTVTDMASSSGKTGVDSTPVTGTRTGNVVPASTAGLFLGVPPTRYRGGKPRIYMPIFGQADLASDHAWAPTPVSNANTAIAGFLADLVGITSGTTVLASYVVAHRVIDKIKQNPIPTGDVTTMALETTPGSQRRRIRP